MLRLWRQNFMTTRLQFITANSYVNCVPMRFFSVSDYSCKSSFTNTLKSQRARQSRPEIAPYSISAHWKTSHRFVTQLRSHKKFCEDNAWWSRQEKRLCCCPIQNTCCRTDCDGEDELESGVSRSLDRCQHPELQVLARARSVSNSRLIDFDSTIKKVKLNTFVTHENQQRVAVIEGLEWHVDRKEVIKLISGYGLEEKDVVLEY